MIGPANGACDTNLISQSLTHPIGCQAPHWAPGDSLRTKAHKVLSSDSSEEEGRRGRSRLIINMEINKASPARGAVSAVRELAGQRVWMGVRWSGATQRGGQSSPLQPQSEGGQSVVCTPSSSHCLEKLMRLAEARFRLCHPSCPHIHSLIPQIFMEHLLSARPRLSAKGAS